MTREIKFRAWDKNKKLFLPEDSFAVLNGQDQLFIMVKDFEDYKEGEYGYSDSFELMQYTGLKDKNGKEIYEGDIVNSSGDRNMQVSIGGYWETVGGNGHGVHIHNQKETRVFGVSPFNQDNALEIIGNIYENPELIK